MTRHLRVMLAALTLTALVGAGCGRESAEPEGTPGPPSALVTFDAAAMEWSEGVAVDYNGNVYASISPQGRLVKIAKGETTASDVGKVEGLKQGDLGLLGLSTGGGLDVYGAVMSANDAARGVWRFDAQSGEAKRVPGTDKIAFPNAIAFDGETMYVTDSIGPDQKGAVWRVEKDGKAELWAQDASFAGDGSLGLGIPIGPNGIDVEGDTVYVGLTEPAKVVSIAIADDGDAGEITVVKDMSKAAPGDKAVNVDGIDVDSSRRVYVAAPLIHFVFLVTAEGEVETVADASDGLDGPASVALGTDALYVSNFSGALGEASNKKGPGITKVPL